MEHSNSGVLLKKEKTVTVTRYFQSQSIDIHSSKGRVGVGLSLSEPTHLTHCQNTYRYLPTCRFGPRTCQ